jgi:hypothetical protein
MGHLFHWLAAADGADIFVVTMVVVIATLLFLDFAFKLFSEPIARRVNKKPYHKL